MRRDHARRHEPEEPQLGRLLAEYGDRVPRGLVEARAAALAADGQDPLSAEHLARAELSSLAAGGRAGRRRR